MSEFYLHKIEEYYFKTYKNTIVFDLDKVKRQYRYYQGVLKKYPKHLKIIGKDNVDFWNYSLYCWGFPVEDVIISTDLRTYRMPFYYFKNVSQLKIDEKVKSVHIVNNLGLVTLKDISIPFSINKFENSCEILKNNLKTLTIYNKDDSIVINLDEKLFNTEINILIKNNGDFLSVKTANNNIEIEYNVYLKDNKLTYDKKYNKYEINAYEYNFEELNFIELNKLYKNICLTGKYSQVKKVILNKEDISYLTSNFFSTLTDIEIIEENDMLLFPKKINISLANKNEYIDKIESINNNLLLKIHNKNNNNNKYIIINNNLSVIYINNNLERILIDKNTNYFKYKDNILTIPFSLFNDIESSLILKDLIINCKYINSIKVIVNNKYYLIDLKKYYNSNLNKSDQHKEYKRNLLNKKTLRKR